MLCDVAFFGELKLPSASVDAFLCSEARDAVLPGFPTDALPLLPRSVEAVLEELSTWSLLAPEWMEVSLEGDSLVARGLVSRDTFLSVAPGLVSLSRTAAPHGGGGTLMMVGLGALSFGYSARCAYGRSSVRTLSAGAVQTLRDSTAVAELRDRARDRFESLVGQGGGAPFTGASI